MRTFFGNDSVVYNTLLNLPIFNQLNGNYRFEKQWCYDHEFNRMKMKFISSSSLFNTRFFILAYIWGFLSNVALLLLIVSAYISCMNGLDMFTLFVDWVGKRTLWLWYRNWIVWLHPGLVYWIYCLIWALVWVTFRSKRSYSVSAYSRSLYFCLSKPRFQKVGHIFIIDLFKFIGQVLFILWRIIVSLISSRIF